MQNKNIVLIIIFIFLTPAFLHAGFWKKLLPNKKKISQLTSNKIAQLPNELKSEIAFYCCINEAQKKLYERKKYELDELSQKLYYKTNKRSKNFKSQRPITYWPGKIAAFDFIGNQLFLLIACTRPNWQTIVLEGRESDIELYRNASIKQKIEQFAICPQKKLLFTIEKGEYYQLLVIRQFNEETKKFNDKQFKLYDLPFNEIYSDISYNPEFDMIMLLKNSNNIKFFPLSNIDFMSDNLSNYLRRNLVCKSLS
ncbi:MAG: hypothetical protein WDZ41_01190 [Candidatus Babeliales bacterium]